MSSEELEKLHEMYRCVYDELKLIPERALRCHGGTRCCSPASRVETSLYSVLSTCCCFVSPAEERKRLVRTFDERQGEAEEVVRMLLIDSWNPNIFRKHFSAKKGSTILTRCMSVHCYKPHTRVFYSQWNI